MGNTYSQDMGNTRLRKEEVARALESSLLSHVACV